MTIFFITLTSSFLGRNTMDKVEKKILQNRDLNYLTNNFSEASVDNLNIWKSLSDADLGKLGVVTIRDHIRFREELRRGNY